MSATISLDDLEKYSDNIYEAIMVIAKRARQINDEQKRQIEQLVGIDEMNATEDEEEYSRNDEERNIIKFPKPTRLAVEEYLQGKIKFEYLEDAE